MESGYRRGVQEPKTKVPGKGTKGPPGGCGLRRKDLTGTNQKRTTCNTGYFLVHAIGVRGRRDALAENSSQLKRSNAGLAVEVGRSLQRARFCQGKGGPENEQGNVYELSVLMGSDSHNKHGGGTLSKNDVRRKRRRGGRSGGT